MAELIHCITNPISMMQCANSVLALGAKPIMAEHPLEVGEITSTASALVLNVGNISDSRMEAMRISFEVAMEKGIPVVIDAVGVACSKLRRDFVIDLLRLHVETEEKTLGKLLDGKCRYLSESIKNKAFYEKQRVRPQVRLLLLKGNYSEIKALAESSYKGKGVDADVSLDVREIDDIALTLSKRYKSVILATGAKDIIVDRERTFFISNGNPMMGQITGTGCMLGAICATFLSKVPCVGSVIKACGFFGIAGEIAYEKLSGKEEIAGEIAYESLPEKEGKVGSGSFLVELLNEISLMDEEKTVAMIKVETA